MSDPINQGWHTKGQVKLRKKRKKKSSGPSWAMVILRLCGLFLNGFLAYWAYFQKTILIAAGKTWAAFTPDMNLLLITVGVASAAIHIFGILDEVTK